MSASIIQNIYEQLLMTEKEGEMYIWYCFVVIILPLYMTKLDLSINISASSIFQASLTDPSVVEIFAIMWADDGSIIYVRIWIFGQNEISK